MAVYFHDRIARSLFGIATGLDACLPSPRRLFPPFRWWVHRRRDRRGIVTTVARRPWGDRPISDAGEYAWGIAVAPEYSVCLATTRRHVVLGPSLYGYIGISEKMLSGGSPSPIIHHFFNGATLIWMFKFLMAVVRGTELDFASPGSVSVGGAVKSSSRLFRGTDLWRLCYQGLSVGRRRGERCVLCLGNAAYAAYFGAGSAP